MNRVQARTLGLLLIVVISLYLPVETVSSASNEAFAFHEFIYSTNYTSSPLPEFEIRIKMIRNELLVNETTTVLTITLEDVSSEPLNYESSRADVQIKEEGATSRILTILIPNSIPSGSQITISISGNLLRVEDGEIDNAISTDKDFKLFAVEAHIPLGSTIIGLSPNTHEQLTTGASRVLKWNYVNKRFATFNIKFIAPFSTNDLVITLIKTHDVVKQGETEEFILEIENKASRSIQVGIIVPKWFSLLREGKDLGSRRGQYILEKNAITRITFISLNTLKAGSYSGTVFVTYEDTIVSTIELEFKIERSAFLQFLLVILSSLVLIGLGAYHFYQKKFTDPELKDIEKEISQLRENVRNDVSQEKNMVKPVISTAQGIPKIDYVTLERLMSAREVSVIEYIHHNPGTSQQSISSDLGISKATISRILKKLEDRKIIRKEQNGMANRIHLELDNLPLKS